MSVSGDIAIDGIEPAASIPPGCTARIDVRVTLAAGSDPLPPYATAKLVVTSGSATLSGAAERTLVASANDGPGVYRAAFYANISGSAAPGDRVGLEATTLAFDTGTRRADAGITVARAVTRAHAANGVSSFDLAQDASGQPMPVYTLIATDGDGAAVADGMIVEWGLAWSASSLDTVRLYADASLAEPLEPDLWPARPNGVVRTPTRNGVARLYVVPDGRETYLRIVAQPAAAEPYAYGDFIIYDTRLDGGFPPPRLNLPLVDGAYDMDGVAGDFADMLIDREDAGFGYPNRVMLFLNGIVKDDTYSSEGGTPLDVKVSKSSFSKGRAGNKAFYVTGNQTTGAVLKSKNLAFAVTGRGGRLVPDPNLSPRVLDGPSVRGAGYYVNTETLAGGGLAVGIAKVQANWTMAAGDVASVTIYLNGDGALDDDIRQASYVRTVTVTEDMLKAEGTAVFVTFERLLVAGYNAGVNAPGSFYAEYALSRPPAGLPRYSNWTGRALDTSAPGEL